MATPGPILSVVIPALNEGSNIGPLIERIVKATQELGVETEIVVVDGGSEDQTWEVAERMGARCISQSRAGYASALLEGLRAARGEYVATLDGDLSHPPELLKEIWAARNDADIVIGSRFAPGGRSDAPMARHALSMVLNKVFSVGLSIPVKDISSGYRLYRREALNLEEYSPEDFNILQELLVRAHASGFNVVEIPLHYQERASGSSHVSFFKFALSYLPTFYRLWKLRNLVSTADYEYRSYSSRHPLQRYWIRSRLSLIRELLGVPKRVLDVGSGSNYLATVTPGLVAIDREPQKIRFLSKFGVKGVVGDCQSLPFEDSSFDQVILSQVLPYVGDPRAAVSEASRVLETGGTVVVCVPDSQRFAWRIFGTLYRSLPNVIASQRRTLSDFTRASLEELFEERGFRVLESRYICGAELVALFQKVG